MCDSPRILSFRSRSWRSPRGCDETLISVSSDGRIEVAVSTNGSDPDSDGFSVTVDGGDRAASSPPGGSVDADGLSAGSHSVLLTGLAENCRVEGAQPAYRGGGPDGPAHGGVRRPLRAGDDGRIHHQVTTIGERRRTPTATGSRVAGADIRAIGTNASETLRRAGAGLHLVTLEGRRRALRASPAAIHSRSPWCAGKTVLVRLAVVCGDRP